MSKPMVSKTISAEGDYNLNNVTVTITIVTTIIWSPTIRGNHWQYIEQRLWWKLQWWIFVI